MNKKVIAIVSGIVIILIAVVLAFVFLKKENLNFGLTKKKFEVTFNTDGGSEVATQTVKENEFATKPADPIKAKNDFIGWYLGEEVFDFTTPITENIPLTAKWVLSDLIMECNSDAQHQGITIKGNVLINFDPITKEVKDANGSGEVIFPDNATLQKMKREVKSNFCSEKMDQSKCIITENGNILKIEVKNEKNIVDVTKKMEDIKKDLEKESFVCEIKED